MASSGRSRKRTRDRTNGPSGSEREATSTSAPRSRTRATTSQPSPADWQWIDTAADLDALVAELRTASRFAIDTESNSMHAYRERICLVQVSRPEPEAPDVLIDPLAVDITPIGALLADAAIEKVMHGADYDILCFKREYDFGFANLFDTMIAARVLQWPRHGLGPILAERHAFVANKKMQRFDWGRRPLPAHALDYARYDTHFLLSLADEQRAALQEAELLDEHAHACLRQTQVEPKPRRAEVEGPWRLKGARGLPGPARGVLVALYELREQVAEQLDRPVFQVMSDGTMMALARRPPRDRDALAKIRDLHPMLRGRGRDRVLAAIVAGEEGPPPEPPATPAVPSRQERARFDALRGWRKDVALARGLEPDIIVGKDSLQAVAEANPESEAALRELGALDAWELERYGAAMLQVLAAV